MANETGYTKISENPLVAKLIAQGAETSKTLRGYIGPSTHEGSVRLYPSLHNLSESFEIAREDILHSAEVPEFILPLGAVFVWVKKDAKIAVRQVDAGIASGVVHRAPDVEVRKGRLRMHVRSRFRRQVEDTCASVCSCGTCQSQCSCTSNVHK